MMLFGEDTPNHLWFKGAFCVCDKYIARFTVVLLDPLDLQWNEFRTFIL